MFHYFTRKRLQEKLKNVNNDNSPKSIVAFKANYQWLSTQISSYSSTHPNLSRKEQEFLTSQKDLLEKLEILADELLEEYNNTSDSDLNMLRFISEQISLLNKTMDFNKIFLKYKLENGVSDDDYRILGDNCTEDTFLNDINNHTNQLASNLAKANTENNKHIRALGHFLITFGGVLAVVGIVGGAIGAGVTAPTGVGIGISVGMGGLLAGIGCALMALGKKVLESPIENKQVKLFSQANSIFNPKEKTSLFKSICNSKDQDDIERNLNSYSRIV